MRMVVTMAALGVLVAGCSTPTEPAGSASDGRYAAGHFKAQATLRTSTGADAGVATVQEQNGGLRVSIDAKGLPQGPHGAHIHTVGRCDAPDFTTAGGHWNPTAHQHGSLNPAGPHGGDIPNLLIGTDGKGSLAINLPAGTFEQLLDQDGAAIVIHAGADDLKTDPSGNSGGRIACGVFEAL